MSPLPKNEHQVAGRLVTPPDAVSHVNTASPDLEDEKHVDPQHSLRRR
ncbi:MAG: hypothetical protein QOJ78_1468 [Pseudonocardiales bacterium]|jgi:hypothetical protein|nr:hypothetical protein [Pseudonocardiales bacterium]MDT4902164.1 hypothetical protein [Pseudonocardiales bacterium]